MAPWCFRCAGCGTWASDLQPGINGDHHEHLDEDLREVGLSRLRQQNNGIVLDRLQQLGLPADGALLDVGAAHGWFVAAAAERALHAQGVEPELAVAARAPHATIRSGYFPDVLGEDELFDAICFNDVLEHIPDVRSAVAASRRHLRPGGLLSINIPNSAGLVHRAAVVLRRVGLGGLFDRVWQVGFPSPHVWYFDEARLRELCSAEGLEPVFAGRLPSISRSGLWQRAHEDRGPSLATVAGVAAAWLGAPVLNSPALSDIMHVVARRPAS